MHKFLRYLFITARRTAKLLLPREREAAAGGQPARQYTWRRKFSGRKGWSWGPIEWGISSRQFPPTASTPYPCHLPGERGGLLQSSLLWREKLLCSLPGG